MIKIYSMHLPMKCRLQNVKVEDYILGTDGLVIRKTFLASLRKYCSPCGSISLPRLSDENKGLRHSLFLGTFLML